MLSSLLLLLVAHKNSARHQECLHFKEEAAMLLYASQPGEAGKNISYKNLACFGIPVRDSAAQNLL
jgi:hypothetical protein